ncbi:transmembrane protein 54 isoform X2 [Tyto alba]|uniref:transmembrane protein 54 isoform X2 n=1 Tax=Tyto alba TaxID=56313 RepID=UPI001C66D66C|nr:transmembrane protein 54 isoform X2 [Tyto alba]
MCQVGHLDPSSHQRVLMKTGLILLIIGHLNFITGALVHGIVLRFVLNPRDAMSLQYAGANTASIISALLKWAVFTLSACSSLGCLSCLLGLAVSIGLTLGNHGQALLAPCTVTDIALTPVSRECPFDPTRVYSSTLSLWVVSLLLDLMEVVFGIRCLLLTINLLRFGRCCRRVHRRKVTPSPPPPAQHRPVPVQDWDGRGWAWGVRGRGQDLPTQSSQPPASFSSSSLACRSPCRQPLRRALAPGSAWVC